PSVDDSCSNTTVTNGSSCYVYVSFAPTSSGYTTGTLTFKNSGGTTLLSVPLAGYSAPQVLTAYLDPTTLNFPTQQVVGTTSSSYQTFTLYNSGNLAMTVGTLTGTNVVFAGSGTGEFSVPSGYNGCGSTTVQPGSSCNVYVYFAPSAPGSRTGSITFPVTYSGGTTANFVGTLDGTGVAERNSAVLAPTNASFVDQTVGTTTSYYVTLTLTNSGNRPFSVAAISGTNTIFGSSGTGEFAVPSGYDGCSTQTVQPGSSCNVYVYFGPTSAGPQSGSITFPVTFADNTTASPVANLSGTGIAATKGLQITPSSLQFPVEMQGSTSATQAVSVKNNGNTSVSFGTDTISGDFAISSDSCSQTTLAYNQICYISVVYKPTTTGPESGTLTIADNASGGPHTVALAGTGIPTSQQIVVSPTTVNFGNWPAGSTSSIMAVYMTNQSDSSVPISSIVLGGSKPGDFTLNTYTCPTGGNNLGARATCYMQVTFAPPTGTATGAVSATVTETDSTSGSPRTITLNGTVVAPGPAVAFAPSSGLTFSQQTVGTTSPAQNFSVTNTGTANLTITSVTSTNSTEFGIYSDGCSGATLTPKQQCVVSVTFSPSLGGTRTGTIKVTDNATGSPQSLAVSGFGYGIPAANPNPTSLTYASTNQGTTTAAQSTVLSNPGTDTLKITGIAITGPNAGDFTISANTCGTTLAPTATCSVSVKFDPTAPGSRTASLTFTDNANNIPGSTQNVTLNGTGVGVPTASPSGPLTFSSTSVGGTSAPQPVTLSNTGGGTLTISNIAFTSTDAGDFSQTNNCGASLAAGSSCTVSVTFKPAASGTRTANLTFTDNSGDVPASKQNVGLTGTAVTPVAPTAVSVSPSSGTGAGPQPFVFTYSDTNPGGYQDLGVMQFVFYPVGGSSYANGCYVQYNPATNKIVLFNNAATGTVGSVLPGGSGTISNSQCSITGNGASAVGSGNNFTLTVPVTFSTTFPGNMTIHGIVYDLEGQGSGANLGTWNTGVEQAPTIVSLSPSSGSGLGPQVFAFEYSDPNGTADLSALYFNFSAGSESPTNGCYVYYYPPTNAMHLYNNAGSGFVAGSTIVGSGGTLSNSQCSISGAGSTVSISGNNITISVSVTFTSTFTAPTNVYMKAVDNESETTGWVNEGTWTP
ncbi:MAG: choice-of-anchor D domain-containing protein, partial [Bryobacteraceae bacterium]